jgi:hypothetical protein
VIGMPKSKLIDVKNSKNATLDKILDFMGITRYILE